MNFLERMRWKSILKGCDYNIAADIITKQWKGTVIKKELARFFDAYLDNPCLETAVDLVKFDPKFIGYFELSKSFVLKGLINESEKNGK